MMNRTEKNARVQLKRNDQLFYFIIRMSNAQN